MKWVPAAFFAMVAVALLAFGAHVALHGAEAPVPRGANVVEGVVAVHGPLHESPAGAPFVAAEVRVQESSADEHATGTVHWRGTFGDREVAVTTSRGERRITLPPAERWRVLPTFVDQVTVTSLRGLPVVGDVQIGERLRPPLRVSVRALRAGTPVIAEVVDGRATRLLVGERARLEGERSERESSRYPIVGLLLAMGLASFAVAYQLGKR